MHFFDDRFNLRNEILNREASSNMTDVERAAFFGLPEGCRIREGAKIISPDKLTIGKNCWIGENAILDASGELEIGNNTSIGLSVFVWTHDSHKVNLSGNNTTENNHLIERRPTKIGSNVFIAGPSVILAGVTIGENCVIAPMSLVSTDIKSNTFYTPYRDTLKLMSEFNKLKEDINILKKNINELVSKTNK